MSSENNPAKEVSVKEIWNIEAKDFTCTWENGLVKTTADGTVYQNNNPLVKGTILIVSTGAITGMIMGAGLGFVAPFYGLGKLACLGGRAMYRELTKYPK